jgi:hypothetical protein
MWTKQLQGVNESRLPTGHSQAVLIKVPERRVEQQRNTLGQQPSTLMEQPVQPLEQAKVASTNLAMGADL